MPVKNYRPTTPGRRGMSVSEVRGFGSFSLRYRPARMGRNPKSGENVEIPGKYAPHFKAGGKLRERVTARTSKPFSTDR